MPNPRRTLWASFSFNFDFVIYKNLKWIGNCQESPRNKQKTQQVRAWPGAAIN